MSESRKKSVVRTVLFGVMTMLALGALAVAASLFLHHYSAADFAKAESPQAKLVILKGLLHSGNDKSLEDYYSLLLKADRKDIDIFQQAFVEAKSVPAILYIGQFVKKAEEERLLMLAGSTISNAQKVALLTKYTMEISERLDLLTSEIKSVVADRPGEMIHFIKKAFAEGADTFDIVRAGGAIAGLKLLGERGFELLLDSITDTTQQTLAIMMLKEFESAAVIPVLKAFEDPASSHIKKETATLLIFDLPLDNALVIDKVVEAYKHGRYFPTNNFKKNKEGKTTVTLNDLLESAESWWGNYLEGRYKGQKAVARYIAEKYLLQADKQDKIIQLISIIDFRTAKPYLATLVPDSLSREACKTLFWVCSPSLVGLEKDSCLDVRFDLFRQVFRKCSKERREGEIFSLKKFPPEWAAIFYVENFATFSDKEKESAIFSCGGALAENFPPALRDLVYKKISPYCNKEQKGSIDYCLKKYQSTDSPPETKDPVQSLPGEKITDRL